MMHGIMGVCRTVLRTCRVVTGVGVVKGSVGKNTIIGRGSVVDRCTQIGKECYVGPNVTITKAQIGNYCSIGAYVVIGPGEHDLTRLSTSARFYQDTYEELTKESCILNHDVWVGTHAIVMRGVTVGIGAVIGANSVVTKDVPDYAVVAGVPARIIRSRFDEKTMRMIKESRFFEKDIDEARRILLGLEHQLDMPSKST